MRLILVRHGQTPSNVAGLLDTAPPGPELTELGHAQAAAIPQMLAGETIDAVFASTQTRAQQTAAPLAADLGLTVGVLPGLREIGAGDLEMAGDADAIHQYIGTLVSWFDGDLTRRIPGGPDGAEVLARFDEAVATITRAVGDRGAAVAVSHGAVIRVWAGLRAAAPDHGQRHLPNTAAVVLDRAAGDAAGSGWTVVDWGEAPLGDEWRAAD